MNVTRDTGQTEPYSINVYTTRELAALELPEPAEAVAGPFLRRGMLTLQGGLTGHGKTTLAYQLVRAAAIGGDILGEQATGGARVAILDLEQHLQSVQRNIREAGLAEVDAVDVIPIQEGLALEKRPDQLEAIEAQLSRGAYDVLVIDPFYKLHESDSSDELQARLLVALLRRWIKEYGFALLTSTHCRKLGAGRLAITLDDLFGSSLFTRDPEIVLGIQRHGALTKLHVFKSREPGLDQGQVFELLFSRERGFWPKPTIDPEERAGRLREVGSAAVEWIAEHPGNSTNKVKQAIGSKQKCGGDLVEEALALQVKSGLLPEPVEGSRRSRLWYPPNHAALTSPESLLGEVTEGAAPADLGATSPDLPDLYVVEGRRSASEVATAPEEAPWP